MGCASLPMLTYSRNTFSSPQEYYASLGYGSLLDGVVGEAEKEGKGEEVRVSKPAVLRLRSTVASN